MTEVKQALMIRFGFNFICLRANQPNGTDKRQNPVGNVFQ